jgi:exosortase
MPSTVSSVPVDRPRAAHSRRGRAPYEASAKHQAAPAGVVVRQDAAALKLMLATVMMLVGLWSYWPTLTNLVNSWWRVADYSHGFLVLPLAAFILWVRRAGFPGLAVTSPWLALAFFAVSLVLRHGGDAFFFAFLGGWSLLPWTAALVLLVGGRPLLAWSWPAVLFLLFMVPLPYSLENELSGPLQRVATVLSTNVLQFLGQPALAEGNVILLGDVRLEVAQACSGLRLFMGIVALTYAYVATIRRPLWEKLVLVAAVAPIAVAANVARITATGVLYGLFEGEGARRWIHDSAGWVMVMFAAAAFWLLLAYLRLLIKEEQELEMSAIVKQRRAK